MRDFIRSILVFLGSLFFISCTSLRYITYDEALNSFSDFYIQTENKLYLLNPKSQTTVIWNDIRSDEITVSNWRAMEDSSLLLIYNYTKPIKEGIRNSWKLTDTVVVQKNEIKEAYRYELDKLKNYTIAGLVFIASIALLIIGLEEALVFKM